MCDGSGRRPRDVSCRVQCCEFLKRYAWIIALGVVLLGGGLLLLHFGLNIFRPISTNTVLPNTTTPSPTTPPPIPVVSDSVVQQAIELSGVTEAQIREEIVYVKRAIATSVNVSDTDVTITDITKITRTRRLLSDFIRILYEVKTTMLDEVESTMSSVNFKETLQEAIVKETGLKDLVVVTVDNPVIYNIGCQDVQCFDNNPCTIDACIDGIGCVVQHQYTNGKCLPGCIRNEQCPDTFICHDGTCLQIDINDHINIRFMDYEIAICDETHHKLVMRFTMDALKVRVGLEPYYRLITSADNIRARTNALGFIHEAYDLKYSLIDDDTSRTEFTLTTECQAVSAETCAMVFKDKEYDFDVHITKCTNLALDSCLDPNLFLASHIDLSISDCTHFDVHHAHATDGYAVFYYDDTRYTGMFNVLPATNRRASLGIIANTGVFRPFIHNIRICACTDCVTCYENPEFFVDLMRDGEFEPLAIDNFQIFGCYPDYVYSGGHAVQCQMDKCIMKDMDDGIRFSMDFFKNKPYERYVIEIGYRITSCGGLRSGEEIHRLLSFRYI